MTGTAFLPALFGASARVATEVAFGANLADATGASWVWTDVTTDVQHVRTTAITQGRADNVGTAGTAAVAFALNNQAGAYTPQNLTGPYFPNVVQNVPIRRRITLDGVTWYTRFQGYVTAWNPRYDISAKVRWCEVTAFGKLGPIDGQKKPLRSPAYRSLAAAAPSMYWPLEDGRDATSAAGWKTGAAPLRLQAGVSVFGAAGPPGAAAALDCTQDVALAQDMNVPPPWRVSFMVKVTAGITRAIPITLVTADNATWYFEFNSADLELLAASADGATTGGVNVLTTWNDGKWHAVTLVAFQNGANAGVKAWIDDALVINAAAFFTSARTLGNLISVQVGYPGYDQQSVCHVAVWTGLTANIPLVDIMNGHKGESSSARLTRLCAEENLPLTVTGTPDQAMGPQPTATLEAILRECEAADHGLLYDGFAPGLAYRARSSKYNQAAALTLNLAAQEGPPNFEPWFDRQAVRNVIEFSRPGGSKATAEQTTGLAGTATIGVEDGSGSANLVDDSDLPDHAGWLLRLGTAGAGYRYPALPLNMRQIPAKAAALLAAGVPGWRLTLQNPRQVYPDLPPDDIDLIVEGWSETWSESEWTLALNCSPYAPYVIAEIGSSDRGRIAAGGASSLPAAITTTVATTFNVTPGTYPWTTLPADLPLDIRINGERMRVTAIGALAAGVQPFTVTRGVNGVTRTHAAGSLVEVWQTAALGL